MRSLSTGFSEMSSLVSDFNFDMFSVTETWLHPGAFSNCYNMSGYKMVRYDRPHSGHSGGGVALYIKEDLLFKKCSLTEQLDPGL